MRKQTEVEKILRRAVKDLNLNTVSWGTMPTYSNSYKWDPPGLPYTRQCLCWINGRLYLKTQDAVSIEKRPYGNSVQRVWGFPTIKTAGINAEVVRRYKWELKALGFHS